MIYATPLRTTKKEIVRSKMRLKIFICCKGDSIWGQMVVTGRGKCINYFNTSIIFFKI
jgi:hypothetical protein